MLRIGFSTKYFTLWNVDTRTEWKTIDGFNFPYQVTYFNYIQNLSMTEEDAIKKAILHGCENLEVDAELYGRNSSWSKQRELFSRIPSNVSYFFEFGKYSGKPIKDTNDSQYLFWYFQETRNIHCKSRLLAEFGFVEMNGSLVHGELARRILRQEEVCEQIRRERKIIGKMCGNLTAEGVGRMEVEDELFIYLKFPEFNLQSYNGHEYGLPSLAGKGKRIKGKILEIEIDEDDKDSLFFDFNVKKFKIIKDQIIY